MPLSLVHRLRDFFNKEETTCVKLVRYQGSSFDISSSGSVGPVTINIGKFSKQISNLTEATSHTKLLDDYQFLLCQEIRNRNPVDKDTKVLKNYRVIAMSYIAEVGMLFEQASSMPGSKALKAKLLEVDQKISDLIDRMEKDLIRSGPVTFGGGEEINQKAVPTLDESSRTRLEEALQSDSQFLGLSRDDLDRWSKNA